MKCVSRKLIRPQWLSIFILAKLANAVYELNDNHERRLNTDFYVIDKNSPPKVEITTLYARSDEENDFPQDDFIHSQMVAADAMPIENDDFTTEKSIGIRLDIGSNPLVFDAIPGPSELSAALEPFQYDTIDGTLPRSNKFWYGEVRDDDDFFSDLEKDPDGRKLREKKKPRQKQEGSFKASINLLKYQSEDLKTNFVSGSITTKDEVYDISIFPNGTTAIEITKWEDFPGHEDHDPPNIYDVHTAIVEQEGKNRFLRSPIANSIGNQISSEMKDNFHSLTASGRQERKLIQALDANNKVVIDVLVLYTRRAMCAQKYLPPNCDGTPGNRAAIEARIDLAIHESNTAYLLSEVFVTLNLKHKELAAEYNDDVNFGQILTQFKDNGDGNLDQVHGLRNKYNADLAVLVVENPTYCGLGYMYNGNKEYGFSVTSRKCMTGYYSFVHELSHNMGCNHNREASTTKFEYSHAFLDPHGQFRTIMGYNCKNGCPRINRFSNPETSYMGKQVGGVGENNARQINSVAQIVADWYREDEYARAIKPTKNPTPSPTEARWNKRVNSPTEAVECPRRDPFGISVLYESDQAQKGNDWISDFPSNASYDKISRSDNRLQIKTYGKVKSIGSDEMILQGPTTLAIAKASNQQGFENTELTAYMKWINDGRFVYESKAVFTARSEALDIEAKGCNGQSYGAIVDRLTGEVKFVKFYYKQSFKEVTSETIVVTPRELRKGQVLSSYVGFKFVVYTVNSFSVKLELYVDLSDGESGGDWKLVHQILDKPNAWKAVEANWHYNYFIRSQCQKTDGEPLLGHRKYEKISVDVSRDAEVAVKNVSIRNISVSKKAQHDQMCTQLQTRNTFSPTVRPTTKPTKRPTEYPTRKPTARPTRRITSSPTKDNTKPVYTSRSRPSYLQMLGNPQSNEKKSNLNLVFSSAGNNPAASPTEKPKAITKPVLKLSFNSASSPSKNAESPKKLNLKFNSASKTAGSNEKCDKFGLNVIYQSDEQKKEDDWDSDIKGVVQLDQYSPTTKLEERLHQVHYGTIKLENNEGVFTKQAQLFVRTKNEDANEGYRSIEVTGYGNYYQDGTIYEDSGFTFIAHSTYGDYDPCKKAAYAATISRKTGEAVFNKIYWAQTWRVVKAVPVKARIAEFRGELPTKQWIGMKFVVLDENNGKVKLQLYIDLTRGKNGGDWKLVLETEDQYGTWMADESASFYKYYKYSKCGENDGKPFPGPTRYSGITVYGSSDTEVHWKNFSIRNVSRNRVANAGSCPFIWRD